MKLTLALLAVGATATRITQEDDYCLSGWYWEVCSASYYQANYCNMDECGWMYAHEADPDSDN